MRRRRGNNQASGSNSGSRASSSCCSIACIGRFLRFLVVGSFVVFLLLAAAAEAYNQSLVGKCEGHLASAYEHFGEGEGVSLHIKSEMAFKQALKVYQYSHARSIDDIRAPDATGAIMRLVRLPLMALKTYAMGIKPGIEWQAVHADLRSYAKKLRTERMKKHPEEDSQMEGSGWEDK
jgi:hypothetical protein